MSSPKYSYMKYWRVVRRYAFMKYDLNQEDLDVLFYIYDEMYFSNHHFEKFEKIMPWDYQRLQRLAKNGWINKLPNGNKYGQLSVYEVTIKTQRVISSLYKILNGDGFPVISQRKDRRTRRYMERRYKNYIGTMVEEIKEAKKREADIKAAKEAERLRDERIRKARGQ
jgi:hypothetical protein